MRAPFWAATAAGAVQHAFHRAAQHVLAADEAGHVGVARRNEDVARAGRLLDAALGHDHDRVGDGDRLELGVGDVDEGDAELLLHATQLAAHAQAQIFIEGGERLVEQQHARIGDQGARQCNALLLAARELGRQAVGELLELHLGQQLARLGMPRRQAGAAHLQGEGHVVEHAAVREQRVALEHHGGAALHLRHADHRLPADADVAAGRLLVAGDHAQDRRLAAATRPQQAAIGAVGNGQAEVLDRDGLANRLVMLTTETSPLPRTLVMHCSVGCAGVGWLQWRSAPR